MTCDCGREATVGLVSDTYFCFDCNRAWAIHKHPLERDLVKKIKSALAITAASALVLGLTACGPSGNNKKGDCNSAGPAGNVLTVERASLPMPVTPIVPRPVTPIRPSIPKPAAPKPAAPKTTNNTTTTTNNAGMPWYWWIPFIGSNNSGEKC